MDADEESEKNDLVQDSIITNGDDGEVHKTSTMKEATINS